MRTEHSYDILNKTTDRIMNNNVGYNELAIQEHVCIVS